MNNNDHTHEWEYKADVAITKGKEYKAYKCKKCSATQVLPKETV